MSDQIEQVMDKAARRIADLLPDLKTFDGKPIVYDWKDHHRHLALGELEPIARLLRAGQGCRDWLHVHGSPTAAIEAWDAALRAALEER